MFKSDYTSVEQFEVGMRLTVERGTKDYETCIVYVQPQLRYNGALKLYERAQHNWRTTLLVNGYITQQRTSLLPDNNTAHNVEAEHKLDMIKGTWYNWGKPFIVEFTNRSTTFTLEIAMGCLNGEPYYCPANGKHLILSYTTAKYTVYPPAPEGLSTLYNKDTNEISYIWDWDPTDKIWFYSTLERICYNASGVPIENHSGPISVNKDTSVYKETLSKEVAYVKWTITNYSFTETPATSEEQTYIIDLDSKVWINVNGQWKKAVPWVNTGAGWKKINKTYVKIGDTFKRVIT